MDSGIKLGKKVFIRNAGKDEYWLQDVIYENPDKLGLGDLRVVTKEKRQSNGGRLDLLLKDPQDNSMYEVEVMLGETDPSHIIRSIEYWDNEKRRFPQRQHFCVLIAESFDRRYFNVIQILSQSVPMIAIQADLLEVDGQYVLNFSKIINVYVEQEEEENSRAVTETTWAEKASWTLGSAKKLLGILQSSNVKSSINYTQSYISILVDGKNSYYLDKRNKPNSILIFNVSDEEKEEAIRNLLSEKGIDFNFNKAKDMSITITDQFMVEKEDVILALHGLRYKEYNSDDSI